jgi:hypothetical protein
MAGCGAAFLKAFDPGLVIIQPFPMPFDSVVETPESTQGTGD